MVKARVAAWVVLGLGMFLGSAQGLGLALPEGSEEPVLEVPVLPLPAEDEALDRHALLPSVGDLVGGLLGSRAPPPPEQPKAPPVPDAPPRVLDAPPAAPEAPAAPLGLAEPAVALVQDLSALPSATLPVMPDQREVGGGATAPPRLPAMPPVQRPRMPASPAAPAAPAPAPPLGSQSIGADMERRATLGEALQGWVATSFGGAFGWYDGMPPMLLDALAGAVALFVAGLLTAGAHLTGFRHVDKQNLLEHTFRQQVLDLVRAEPGLHLRELARRLGLTATNAAYHLRVLERHGLLCSERLNGKRVFMPAAGPVAHQRFLAQALLQRDSRARVLRALVQHPGINQSAVAVLTQQHQGAVSWHLRQLVQVGVVAEERTPRECRYRLTTLGAELAAPPAAAPAVASAPSASGSAPAGA